MVVVNGVPLPDRRSTGNLLVGSLIGHWLHSHRSDLRGTLLDLGCGSRPYAPWYTDLVSAVVAIDPAPGSECTVQAFADQIPLVGGCVDVVLCTEVLEHVENLEAAMAEVFRVLRPGGAALITVPFLYPTHEEPYDFQRLTYIGLRSLLVRHGLVVDDLACNGGPGTLVGSWFFRGVRVAIDLLGRRLGLSDALSLRAPFSWVVNGPQLVILALRSGRMTRLTRLSEVVSTGYMVRAHKPAASTGGSTT